MSLEWRESCQSNNAIMQAQDCSSQAKKKVWLGLVLALVVGQGLLLPSHQCLSILEILMSLSSHPLHKTSKNVLLQGWESRHRDAKWFFYRRCKTVLEPGTKPRSPEFQSMEGHSAVTDLWSRNWEFCPLAVCLHLLAAAEDWDLLQSLKRLKVSNSIKV